LGGTGDHCTPFRNHYHFPLSGTKGAEHEVRNAMVRIALHDVPDDPLAADGEKGLGEDLACVSNPRALPTAKDDCFHGFIFLLEQRLQK
jgi:hypothetical protein